MKKLTLFGMYFHIRTHRKKVCACAYISAWASVLLVRIYRQYQSLEKRNSNSAVPLFVFTKAEQQFS